MTREQSSEKKQIKLDVKYRIKRGEPKQQILEDLSPLYKDKAFLVKTITATPSVAMKTKYKIHNYLLVALLFAAFVVDVILFIRLELWKADNLLDSEKWVVHFNVIISIILDIVFITGVLLYRINIYSWIACRALITLIAIIAAFGANDMLVYFSLSLIMISFILGLFLSVKLCPARVPKTIEREIDLEGSEKIIKKNTIYVFPD